MKIHSPKTLYPESDQQEFGKIRKNCKGSVHDEVLS